MQRVVEPEWLDELPPEDIRAVRSRRDLRRLNFLMGHVGIMARLWRQTTASSRIKFVVDLGAGDGSFLLSVAKRLGPRGGMIKAVLLDRRPVVSGDTCRAFESLGWEPEVVTADAIDWLQESGDPDGTVILANLFLHHFQAEKLRLLLRYVAHRAQLFLACEPRRAPLASIGSHLTGLVGCNAITRHDAVVSVRAGFAGGEICRLWPKEDFWSVREGAAGLFTHTVVAQRS